VGIIGRNGAGKTTLLKILSRITEPTEGYAEIRGRVGSLLEVGTGFHAELTGRENIYLNGAILGMKKAEIDRKFDEIVSFAEIDKFLDTPVKHYSSGMYVRLAFAVAAHMEPEILLVDEVLAVGDFGFQIKCLDKIKGMSTKGTVVLLVSHNLHAVEELCGRVILLCNGRIHTAGGSIEVVRVYKKMAHKAAMTSTPAYGVPFSRFGSGLVNITEVELLDESGNETSTFRTGGSLRIRMKCTVKREDERITFGVAIFRQDGLYCFGVRASEEGVVVDVSGREAAIEFEICPLQLLEGVYQVSIAVWDENGIVLHDIHERMYEFLVEPSRRAYGPFFMDYKWTVPPR